MKVIPKKNIVSPFILTPGKEYQVNNYFKYNSNGKSYTDPKLFEIKCNDGEYRFFNQSYFLSVDEVREIKLNKLL